MFHVLFYYFPSWDFICDNDNGSQSHNENHSQVGQQQESCQLCSYINIFIFGIVCAIARYMPRKLFLYQLLIMRMISKIKDLLRMIMIIVIKSSLNQENTIFFIAHATATPPVPRYIHVQLHRLGILGVNHKGK